MPPNIVEQVPLPLPSGVPVESGATFWRELEAVPNPNFGTPYGNTYFTRWTYSLRQGDGDGALICSSGSESDAVAQSLSWWQTTGANPINSA